MYYLTGSEKKRERDFKDEIGERCEDDIDDNSTVFVAHSSLLVMSNGQKVNEEPPRAEYESRGRS